MTNNKSSTRYHSNKHEKKVAKTIGGKCQSNSGATLFAKGDIQTDKWLIECKTCMTEKQSFSVKKEWLDKLKQEAFAMNKEFYSLVFSYGETVGENYYILNEKVFKQIFKLLQEIE